MVQRTNIKPQGKAWWVQLQHQRAVDAGCHFYSYRPATSSPTLSKQQATSFNHVHITHTRRPSTSVCVKRSPEDANNAFHTPAPQQGSCLMRPCTSPKRPARRALCSRQASRSQMSSTAVSNQLPASRGNDWSPVHSRPATRSAISNMHKVKLSAEAQIQPPESLGFSIAAGRDTADVLVIQPAQPAIPKHRQLRPNRSCCLSHKQSPTEDSPPTPDRPASVGFAVELSASAMGKGESPHQPAPHTAAAPSRTALTARTPVVINAGDRVKMYSRLHPGQRQHDVALLKAPIADRFEAWATLTEAQLAVQTPRTVQREETEAAAAVEAVAVAPVQYRAVPPGRGAQRAAVHSIMKPPVVKQHSDNPIPEGSPWESKRMKSAFVKAVHVAKFTEGAAVAQRRRELAQQQQQQLSSSSVLRHFTANARSKAAQQKPNAVADSSNTDSQNPTAVSSPSHDSATDSFHQGSKPLAFKLLMAGKCSVPNPSRRSSHEPALADRQPEPLVRRRSTVDSHTLSLRAFPPDTLLPTKRPATVGCVPSGRSHAEFTSTSSSSLEVDSPRQESAAAEQESLVPAISSTNHVQSSGQTLPGGDPTSADSAMQPKPGTAHGEPAGPAELWHAALSAAELRHLQGSEQAICSKLVTPAKCRQSCLTPNNMLAFAQADLTSSNDTSPTLSPRPPSFAVDAVLARKARCALAASNSPGVTPRLAVCSKDLGVGRFQSHDFGNDQGVERVRERCAVLAARLAAQASTETQDGCGETASANMMLQDQVLTANCMVCVRPVEGMSTDAASGRMNYTLLRLSLHERILST